MAVLVVGLGVPLALQHHTARQLRAENDALRLQAERVQAVTAENTRLSRLLAQASTQKPKEVEKPTSELLRLRGQVSTLRKTADEAAALRSRQQREGANLRRIQADRSGPEPFGGSLRTWLPPAP